MILTNLEVGPYGTNCYIVGCESSLKGLVVDPGDEAEAILKEIKALNLEIELIVVTHGHFDHTGAIKDIIDATGAKLAIHAGKGEMVRNALLQRIGGFITGNTSRHPHAEIMLNDEQIVKVGSLVFKVLYTPGHSPDGISLYGHDVVFSGDSLFNCGIGRTDFPGSSHAQLIQSIKEKLFILPDNTTVYPGHGPSTLIEQEKRGNPFLR